MRAVRGVALCLAIAACTPARPPDAPARTAVPQRAILYPVGLTLLMSDKTLCVGHRPGRARDWSGHLAGCPHLLRYEVRDSDPGIVRLELRQGGTGPGAKALVDGRVFAQP